MNISNLKIFRQIIIIILIVSGIVTIGYSWLNGDYAEILQEYLEQSNSKYAVQINKDLFGIIDLSIMTIPSLGAKLGEPYSDLLLNAFQKATIKDGIMNDLPAELGVFDRILSALKPSVQMESNNMKFGKLYATVGDYVELNVKNDSNNESDFLVFMSSSNPNIVQLIDDDIKKGYMRFAAIDKGRTVVNVMKISEKGVTIKRIKVKIRD